MFATRTYSPGKIAGCFIISLKAVPERPHVVEIKEESLQAISRPANCSEIGGKSFGIFGRDCFLIFREYFSVGSKNVGGVEAEIHRLRIGDGFSLFVCKLTKRIAHDFIPSVFIQSMRNVATAEYIEDIKLCQFYIFGVISGS